MPSDAVCTGKGAWSYRISFRCDPHRQTIWNWYRDRISIVFKAHTCFIKLFSNI